MSSKLEKPGPEWLSHFARAGVRVGAQDELAVQLRNFGPLALHGKDTRRLKPQFTPVPRATERSPR